MQTQYAICLDNTGYEASLILEKIYLVVQDEQAQKDDLIRIIDESGEDYLYAARRFRLVEPS